VKFEKAAKLAHPYKHVETFSYFSQLNMPKINIYPKPFFGRKSGKVNPQKVVKVGLGTDLILKVFGLTPKLSVGKKSF
jgi:hypothetical protein